MKKNLSLVIVGLLCLSTFSVFAPQVKADSESIIFQDDFETFEGARAPELLAMFSYAEEMIDHAWSFPNGTTFTFRGWLQSKGFSVSTVSEAFPTGEITLSGLQDFQAILAFSDFFGDPANVGYIGTILDYVSLGGGLILLGQGSHPSITIDEAFGFCWSGSAPGPIDPWSFYVDAGITDYSHPIMQGITELPKAGGVFVDWDTLIDETPLPSGTAVLARTLGTGGPYDPIDRIAMIAFQYGDGKVVAGPWDGLVRPYGPTAVNPWDVIAEPIIENKLLINAINWIAGAGVITLPAGLWHPYWRFITDPINDARLDRIDLDSMTSGDQQVVTVGPGEEVTIDYSAWLSGNPGEIRQLWFVYSWASSYPPWDAYTPIYNGQPYPSRTVANSFSITTPTTPGTYKVWLCVQSQYNMNDAVADVTEEPTMLPHALIIVCARAFDPSIDGFSFDNFGFFVTTEDEIRAAISGNPELSSLTYQQRELLVQILSYLLSKVNEAFTYVGIGGHCYGMSAAARYYFLDPSEPEPNIVFEMPFEAVAPTIRNLQLSSYVNPYALGKIFQLYLSPLVPPQFATSNLAEFSRIKDCIEDEGVAIVLLQNAFTETPWIWESHAVLAYRIEETPTGWTILIYDPNEYGETQFIEVSQDYSFSYTPPYTSIEFHQFGAIVSDATVFDYLMTFLKRIYAVLVHSPVQLHMYDNQGNHVGPMADEALELGFHSLYLGDYQPQMAIIPSPSDEVYNVVLEGVNAGEYSLSILALDDSGAVIDEWNFAGETVEGAVYIYNVRITDGVITTTPDPVAELEHLKGFINGLPTEVFDRSIRRASCLKNALSNKIDEVILKVEAGNYTDAINKLFWDIRAKMAGDSAVEDWIIDSQMQFRLCVIIDHIISSIETL